ncbi:hypothetical protein DFP72DRAFT_974289 [Ephemerocybe angulata]|uniref:Uncharacterized protein n=1 Tax=Ephemerocybe angulata TaxID=980116 RepID=A0A8H6LX52_9AGAR|nr:hypothetical protein DFP72DRAFT_974289 [Tulosesus angulatus]
MPERDDTLDGPLLPMEMEGESPQKRGHSWLKSTKARLTLLGGLVFSILLLAALFWSKRPPTPPPQEDMDLDVPPLYHSLFEAQRKLPQHDTSLLFPEGASGRYVKFTSQSGARLLGWNNVFTELLLHNYLSYKAHRGYVFGDYLWAPSHYPWPENNITLENPARTPISAIISGPTAGGPWPPGDPAPRAIHEQHWPLVCPPEKVKQIWTSTVKDQYNIRRNGSATYIFNIWKKILLEEPAQCVEVMQPAIEDDPWPEVFDMWLVGFDRLLDFWDEFRGSLVSQQLGPSAVVQRALERNVHLFQTPETEHRDPFSRVLAVHIRRGDYEWHCGHLANWNFGFYGWNQLPWLPDRFVLPPGGEPNNNTEENIAKFKLHCLPEMDQIIKRIEGAREDWEKDVFVGKTLESHYINTIFILTNASPEWHDEFVEKLKHDHKWRVVTSHNITFGNSQEKDVGMAVDMEIARRAGIFLGNGWSSFTSNIIHQRLVDKKSVLSNRFF